MGYLQKETYPFTASCSISVYRILATGVPATELQYFSLLHLYVLHLQPTFNVIHSIPV